MKITHITPALPPVINGVGDFSKILVDNLVERGCGKNSYLIYRKDFPNKSINEPVLMFDRFNLFNQLSLLAPDIIILHYVGYAYDKNGVPFYLPLALAKYVKKHSFRVFVFFHELYSSSNNPLKIPFYTNFFQKRIVKKLNSLAYITFTNCEIYHCLLARLVSKVKFNNVCTGIYSNIPDVLYDPSILKERSTMVVFGSYARRVSIYRNPKFSELLERMAIKHVYDVGPGKVLFNNNNVEFSIKGSMPVSQVAEVLNKVRFGAIDYPPHVLGKSGILSAYGAFGVIPINFCKQKERLYDNLIKGVNYFTSEMVFENEDLRSIETKVLEWYSNRSSKKIIDLVTKFF